MPWSVRFFLPVTPTSYYIITNHTKLYYCVISIFYITVCVLYYYKPYLTILLCDFHFLYYCMCVIILLQSIANYVTVWFTFFILLYVRYYITTNHSWLYYSVIQISIVQSVTAHYNPVSSSLTLAVKSVTAMNIAYCSIMPLFYDLLAST